MTSAVDLLFSSTGSILVLGSLAIWAFFRPQSRFLRRLLLPLTAIYLLASAYAVPYAISRVALVSGLRPFVPGDVKPGRIAIVILGGSAETVVGWDGDELAALSGDGLERVLEAARVYRLTSAEWIITSGGVLDDSKHDEANANIMRDGLVRLGVPASRILQEATSRTTHDEAVLIEPMLRSLGASQVVLVTSDIHMRRSLGTFRASGILAVPAIARDPGATRPLRGWIAPTPQGLMFSQHVAHELLGLAYYAARGWWRF